MQCLSDWFQFSKLIEWTCSQLKAVTKIDEFVNSITSSDDLSSFLMELSSLLNGNIKYNLLLVCLLRCYYKSISVYKLIIYSVNVSYWGHVIIIVRNI